MQQRVLIIDDEGAVRDVARAYLERERFAVETAAPAAMACGSPSAARSI